MKSKWKMIFSDYANGLSCNFFMAFYLELQKNVLSFFVFCSCLPFPHHWLAKSLFWSRSYTSCSGKEDGQEHLSSKTDYDAKDESPVVQPETAFNFLR